jgi:hypothetical protein
MKVPEAVLEAACRKAFRSDNGGSSAPVTDGEREHMRPALEAAIEQLRAELEGAEVVEALAAWNYEAIRISQYGDWPRWEDREGPSLWKNEARGQLQVALSSVLGEPSPEGKG